MFSVLALFLLLFFRFTQLKALSPQIIAIPIYLITLSASVLIFNYYLPLREQHYGLFKLLAGQLLLSTLLLCGFFATVATVI